MVSIGGRKMPRRGENIHKRADNRWEGRYIKDYDINGKARYVSVYAKSYLEVKKKLNLAKEQAKKTENNKNINSITFGETLNLWLENNRIKLKEQTYAKYRYLSEKHILPEMQDVLIKKIDSVYINQFLYSKANVGRLDGTGGLSSSYIRTIAFIIVSTMNFSANMGFCAPLNNIVRPSKEYRELEILTVKEQEILEKYIKDNVDKRKIGILLSLYAGLRIGEVCGLRWCDIDFENQTIHIRHTVNRVIDFKENIRKTKLVIGNTKTISSNRIIPLPESLLQILKENYNESQPFVIPGISYPFTDPRTYQYCFQQCLKNCQLRKINYHALRHTFATRCIESGMDIKTLSEILGHASVNITLNTYVHSSLEHKRKQINKMSAIYGQ